MIIEPGWLETIQLLIRIALILLSCNLVSAAFKSDGQDSPIFFMLILGMGSGLLTMVAGSVFNSFPGGIETLIVISVFIGISIIAAGTVMKAETSRKGYKHASGLWMSGIIGIAIGTGYYLAAIVVAVISYFILNKINTGYSVS